MKSYKHGQGEAVSGHVMAVKAGDVLQIESDYQHTETWSVSGPNVVQNLIPISLLGVNVGLMVFKSCETV